MKSVRLSGLAASTALALILALSSQPGQAQSTSDGQAQSITTPAPDAAAKPSDKTAAAPAKAAQQGETTMSKPDAMAAHAAKDNLAPANADSAPAPKVDTAAESKPKAKPDADTTSQPAVSPAEKPAETASGPATTAPKADSTAAKMSPARAAETAAVPKAGTKTEAATAAQPEAATEAKTEPNPEAKPETAARPAEPQAKVTSSPVPSAADVAVTAALKDMITGRVDRYLPRRDDREGVEAFYKTRDYKPLWVANGAADARAKAAIAYLASVAADGLNPSDYPTPNFSTATGPDALAAAELKLTNSVLIYAHDAQIGRINITRVGNDVSFKLKAPEPAAVLANMADTKNVAVALDGYNPPQAGFKALKKKLAELRAGKQATGSVDKNDVVRIPRGPVLRPGMRDPRVTLLRKRLDVAGNKHSQLYDQDVVNAVKAFQMKSDIGVDGIVGPSTLNALNGAHGLQIQPRDPIETVIVNMERWRWLPRKLGNAQNTYVMVNVPNYTLRLVHDGKIYWKTKIVVGKPSKATPMTAAEMKYITVNPIWNVPPSIVENEYLPALEQDPDALQRIGLKIRQDPDGTVHIFQPPGPANALGRIRFNFPNKFLVYQHDTPDKYLFKRTKRAYSHGCMRVQNPVEYATKLLSLELPQDHYSPARIESMYGPDEININFPRPIPVYLTYQTAFVDQNGKLQFREDIYGRDARMIAILKNARERRVAYIPVQNPPNTSDKPVRMPVGMFDNDGGYVGSGYNGNGSNFFDWLFGDRPAQSPPSYYRRNHFISPPPRGGGLYSQR